MWAYNYLFGKEKVVPKYVYNFKRQTDDLRDLQYESLNFNFNLPNQFSLREQLPPVLDQGRLGSCVSNATANALRFCLKKEHLIDFAPSRLYMYYYTRLIEGHPNEDTGTTIRDMMKELHTYGDCHEDLWPYDISQFRKRPSNECTKEGLTHIKNVKYHTVRQDLSSLKSALFSGFPVIFGVSVYESFQSQESMTTGNIPMPNTYTEELLGGHCLQIISYCDDTQTFGLQNSWSDKVGDKGYFTIPYKYVLDRTLASDFWVVNFWN
jgi:C1A family cysteine protease